MKKIFTLITTGLIFSGSAFAQWCIPTTTPTTLNSYSSNSPVITNVTFKTINRTTAASNKELYVNTGIGTTVSQGSTELFSMTFTRDVPICPTHNIRVWIDWNLDGDFSDAGELAHSADDISATSSSGNITVPANATLGTTRMRTAMKMSVVCGHTMPDPCVPPEAVGWHGEIEDYDLTIISATGINELGPASNINLLVNQTDIQLSYFLNHDSDVQLDIYNAYGQKMNAIFKKNQISGLQKIQIDRTEFSAAGMYIATLYINGYEYSRKFVLSK